METTDRREEGLSGFKSSLYYPDGSSTITDVVTIFAPREAGVEFRFGKWIMKRLTLEIAVFGEVKSLLAFRLSIDGNIFT